MVCRRLAYVIGVLAAVLWAGSAGALFHLAVIDEVMTSYGGDPNVQFIEIRMLAGSQNFVQNSVLAAFDNTGAYINDILVVPANVPNSGANIRWIVGTSAFVTASAPLAVDFVMPAGILPTAGGMVCFGGGGGIIPAPPGSWSRTTFSNYVDCVAYGNYAGPSNLLIGTPTTVTGDGHSVQRVGASNNNLADFICGDPANPENNAGVTVNMVATTPCPAPPGPCPASPDGGCTGGFGKGGLLIKEDAGKEALLAKFLKGPALAQINLGNPLISGGTAYALCIYDNAGALAGALEIDRAGDTCGSAACWKAIGGDPPNGRGYTYKDDALAADGVFKVLYKGGLAGKSKVIVKGRGTGLPANIADALTSATGATVQFRSSNALCLSVNLATIKKQEANFFKAK